LKYGDWLQKVPEELSGDPLWRMEAYRLALFAGDLAWSDVSHLIKDGRTRSLADQLYRAVGPVAANIAEGYSKSSHRDQARFYEYALGSAREARGWYYQGRHVLPEAVSIHRIQLLTQVIRLLLATVHSTRGHRLYEQTVDYAMASGAPLQDPSMP
jgi:four helix bundle protein